ncbi:MAG: signal peptidase II [Gemmataceae bacterium]
MTPRSYRWLFWTMAFLGLALDQGGKYGIFSALYHEGRGGQIVLVDGLFTLDASYQIVEGKAVPHVNDGALWGWKPGLDGSIANNVFAVVSLIAAAAIVFWSALPSSPRDRWLNFALGLIFAGAVGNLYDRVVFRGVRDFLHFYPQGVGLDFNFPVFNIADCCLVCGAGVLMLHALLVQPHHEKAPAPEAAEAIAPALTPAPEAEAAVSK